ncbi:hypothetical protein ILUMI_01344 [Ignelater luminosus]|uniref:Uncharacterized protein n=1 Tax=Ignelater luminosus TaxID=2038154 RepID=A0A8K0DEU7_IGNLU|nr:hypothetical protein ILUMI_01344 [Ignelater luminosus]
MQDPDAADQLSEVSVAILQEDSNKQAEEALENAELRTKYVDVGPCLESHENSSEHKKSLLVWLTQKENKSVINKKLQGQLKNDTEYYHNVLKRVVAVVKYLRVSGLAFRDHKKIFGNFMGSTCLRDSEEIIQNRCYCCTMLSFMTSVNSLIVVRFYSVEYGVVDAESGTE